MRGSREKQGGREGGREGGKKGEGRKEEREGGSKDMCMYIHVQLHMYDCTYVDCPLPWCQRQRQE